MVLSAQHAKIQHIRDIFLNWGKQFRIAGTKQPNGQCSYNSACLFVFYPIL